MTSQAPTFTLELTHGPFVGTQKVNCMASRWPDTAPSGALVSRCGQRAPGGRHWYVVPRVGYPEPETFSATLTGLTSVLDAQLAEHGIGWEQTVLGGFSQGAVMSYAAGLGAGRPLPAGILAMSGFIPTVAGWELRPDGLQDYPVAIAHGSMDPVISVDFALIEA